MKANALENVFLLSPPEATDALSIGFPNWHELGRQLIQRLSAAWDTCTQSALPFKRFSTYKNKIYTIFRRNELLFALGRFPKHSSRRGDFEGFDWISAKKIRSTKTILSQECLVFSDETHTIMEPAPGEQGPPRQSIEHLEAYIDATNRLPVSLKNADGIATYKFLTPPGKMQTLPGSIVSLLFSASRSRALCLPSLPDPFDHPLPSERDNFVHGWK